MDATEITAAIFQLRKAQVLLGFPKRCRVNVLVRNGSDVKRTQAFKWKLKKKYIYMYIVSKMQLNSAQNLELIERNVVKCRRTSSNTAKWDESENVRTNGCGGGGVLVNEIESLWLKSFVCYWLVSAAAIVSRSTVMLVKCACAPELTVDEELILQQEDNCLRTAAGGVPNNTRQKPTDRTESAKQSKRVFKQRTAAVGEPKRLKCSQQSA